MKGEKGDQRLTKQLCLGKETIYQKAGEIYAQRSIKRQIRGAQRPLQLVRQQLGRPLDTLGRLLHLLLFGKG